MSEDFRESHWGQCLELLSHLCQYSSSILLVTGPSGIGKTKMKQALIYLEQDNYIVREVQAAKSFTNEDLSSLLDVNGEDAEKDVLLLIDDAQNLPIDVVAVLLQLKQKAAVEGKLRIVLFATMELEQRILRSILKEDFSEHVHTIEIEPLTASEVEAFLMQEWRNTNNDGASPFDRARCKKIYSLSGGIPGKVQQIARDFLRGKDDNKLASESKGLSPVMVGVTVSFGVLFCILAILWPTADNKIVVKEEPIIAQTQPDVRPEAENTENLAAAIETAPLAASNETMPDKSVETVALVESVATSSEETLSIEPTIAQDNYAAKIDRLEKSVQNLQQQLNKEQEARRMMEMQYKHLVSKQTHTNLNPRAKTIKPVLPKSKKSLSFSKYEKHILSLPSKNYALQLLCLNNEAKVVDFIKQHKLEHKASYYKSTFKGKDWFILVYGNYANKADAQLALAKLPKSLKKLHPWPREYNNIQGSIKKRVKND
jgi:DamX protein